MTVVAHKWNQDQNAMLRVIEQAGHWLHVEQPQIFITEVQKFLSQ